MHAGGPIPGCFEPADPEEADGDILKLYPRMMHPHRVNELARRYLRQLVRTRSRTQAGTASDARLSATTSDVLWSESRSGTVRS